jgi:hypothetical protein
VRRLLYTLFLFTVTGLHAIAQSDTMILRGTVTDSMICEALPFVAVYIDSIDRFNRGPQPVTTDLDGNFRIKVPVSLFKDHKVHQLVFHYIGYEIHSVQIDPANHKRMLKVYARSLTPAWREYPIAPVEWEELKKDN